MRGSWRPVPRGLWRVLPRLWPPAPRLGLSSLVRAGARRHPDRVAWRDDDRVLTWADLRALADDPLTGRHVVREQDHLEVALAVLRCQAGRGEAVVVPWRGGAQVADAASAGPLRPGSLTLATSGTTGTPKLTPGRARAGAAAMYLGLIGSLPLPRHPVVACLSRLDTGHGMGLFVATLAVGGTFCPPGATLATADLLSGVPAALARTSIRAGLVLSGSDVLTPDAARTIARATGGRVVDAYGATEMGTVALDGVLMPGVTARVVDGVVEVTSPLAREPFRGDRGEIVGGRLRIHGRADGAASSAGEPLHEHRLRDWLSDKGIQTDISLIESPLGQRFAVATTDDVDPDAIARDLGNAYRPIVRRRP